MADESNTQSHQTGEAVEKADHAEVTDRGFYNHLVGKKEKEVEDERNTQSHETGEAVEKPDQVEVTNGGFYNHLVGKKEKEVEDERNTQLHQTGEAVEKPDHVEVTDRGFFNHLVGNKEKEVEDKRQEEELATGMEKVSVEEPEEKKEEHDDGEKHESLLTKLQRSSSSSSSSSDEKEEVIDDNGEVMKRRKKKGLKEKIKENLPGHKDSEGEHVTGLPAPAPAASVQTHGGHHDTDVAVEKIDGDAKIDAPTAVPEEEKKGFLEKIKEKLPGGHKKPEDAAAVPVTHAAPAPVHAPAAEEVSSPDGEKKGLLGKIMDKLPGYNKAAGEEDKAAAAAGEHKTSS